MNKTKKKRNHLIFVLRSYRARERGPHASSHYCPRYDARMYRRSNRHYYFYTPHSPKNIHATRTYITFREACYDTRRIIIEKNGFFFTPGFRPIQINVNTTTGQTCANIYTHTLILRGARIFINYLYLYFILFFRFFLKTDFVLRARFGPDLDVEKSPRFEMAK